MLLLSALAAAEPLSHAQVARHDTAQDCWLVIDGQVYDVTRFIEAHPGGEAILRGCGKDATWLFAHRDASGHSAAAQAMLEQYRIGALGDPMPEAPQPPPAPHPFSLTADGRRVGILGSTAVAPRRSINLGVDHRISTVEGEPTRVGFDLGVGFGLGDVHVWDATGDDVSGLAVKLRPLDQHGEEAAPLSVALEAGMGMYRDDGPPAFFGQLSAERTLMDRRLSLRGTGIGSLRDAFDVAAGGGLELRPIAVHGLFGEVLMPLTTDAALAWSAGARIYTRGHHFSLYVSSTPTNATPSLVAPVEAFSVGFGLERAFMR